MIRYVLVFLFGVAVGALLAASAMTAAKSMSMVIPAILLLTLFGYLTYRKKRRSST